MFLGMSYRKKCVLTELLDLDLKEGCRLCPKRTKLEELQLKLILIFWFFGKDFLEVEI